MQPLPLHQPVTGLSQALALNAAELDKKQAFAQLHTLRKNVPFGAGKSQPAPLAYEPHPEAASFQHNLAGFLQSMNSASRSANPYNDHRYFTQAPVLKSGWADAPAVARLIAAQSGRADAVEASRALVAPGRFDGSGHNVALVQRFQYLLGVSGFDKRFPVLFDRNGQLLDGWHRLLACALTESRYFFLQLDF